MIKVNLQYEPGANVAGGEQKGMKIKLSEK